MDEANAGLCRQLQFWVDAVELLLPPEENVIRNYASDFYKMWRLQQNIIL